MDLWVEFRCCNISLVGVLTPNTLCLVILILFTNEGQARCRPVERLHRWSCRTRHAFPATPCLPGEKQSTSISSCPWSPVSWLCSHRMSHGERSIHPLVAREGTILIYIYTDWWPSGDKKWVPRHSGKVQSKFQLKVIHWLNSFMWESLAESAGIEGSLGSPTFWPLLLDSPETLPRFAIEAWRSTATAPWHPVAQKRVSHLTYGNQD